MEARQGLCALLHGKVVVPLNTLLLGEYPVLGPTYFCACLKKITSLARAAMLFANLPNSLVNGLRRGWFITTKEVDVEIGVRLDNILVPAAAVLTALL